MKTINIYEVDTYENTNSDYYVEYYAEEFDNKYTEFWLCRRGYGIKRHLISFETNEPEEWLSNNIDMYIRLYDEEFK